MRRPYYQQDLLPVVLGLLVSANLNAADNNKKGTPTSTIDSSRGVSDRTTGASNNNWNSSGYHDVTSGCLFSKLPGKFQRRVCNSEDSPDQIQQGICIVPSIEYLEIRIDTLAWLSALLEGWLVQILLSELLGVPTTIETGDPAIQTSNYYYNHNHNHNHREEVAPPIQIPAQGGDQWELFERAYNLSGDCRLANRSREESYEACGHFSPEVWNIDVEWLQPLIASGVIQRPQNLGVSGREGWYIPKATAQKDPSLMSYLGYQGIDNKQKQKLANRFPTPVTWGVYCQQVSPDNCRTPNDVAQRPPSTRDGGGGGDSSSSSLGEQDRYFVPGLYTGHFQQFTDRNKNKKDNCANYSSSLKDDCDDVVDVVDVVVGHGADFVYNGFSLMPQITHHLDIALQSFGPLDGGGYSMPSLEEIYMAANATNSDVLIVWYTPDVLHEKFLHTDYELLRVALPKPTQNCVKHRYNNHNHNHDNGNDAVDGGGGDADNNNNNKNQFGHPEGACDYDSHPLKKLLSSTILGGNNATSIPEPIRPPTLEALTLFQLTETQLNELLLYYNENIDNPREAVCQWAVDNLDLLQSFVPPSYPRVAVETAYQDSPLFFVAMVVAIATVLLVLITAILVFRQRHRRVMRYAQVDFLGLTLSGLFLVSLGALLNVLPPSTATCTGTVWLVNIGYTLYLVPLLVKVSAINRLMNASRKMKRVSLDRNHLYRAVVLVVVIVVVYCALWTSLDPHTKSPKYELITSQQQNPGGWFVVEETNTCSSKSVVWYIVTLTWNLFLLISTSVLAFQMRGLRQEFNESQALANVAYFHFVGTSLVVMTLILKLESTVNPRILMHCLVLILCVDTASAIGIYFVPKFLADDRSAAFSSTVTQTRQPPDFTTTFGGGTDLEARLSSSVPSTQMCNRHCELCERLGRQEEHNIMSKCCCPHCNQDDEEAMSLIIQCAGCGNQILQCNRSGNNVVMMGKDPTAVPAEPKEPPSSSLQESGAKEAGVTGS